MLSATKFAGSPIIAVSADVAAGADGQQQSLGLGELFDAMRNFIQIPDRTPEGPFLFAVDHWYRVFSLEGSQMQLCQSTSASG